MLRGTVATLSVLLALPVLRAQGTGEISGVVRDGPQARLAKVRVTVTNQATRSEAIFYTDDQGLYRAVNLAPSLYTVEAARSGLLAAVRRDLDLRQGGVLRFDLELAAAGGWSMPAPGSFAFLALAALITLLITETGRKLLRELWKPVVWVKDRAYSFLAPRFPHGIGVPGYRKRVQRSDLSRLEVPVGPQELAVPLEQAFVPLMLVTGDRQERIDLFPFAATNRRLIVLVL